MTTSKTYKTLLGVSFCADAILVLGVAGVFLILGFITAALILGGVALIMFIASGIMMFKG